MAKTKVCNKCGTRQPCDDNHFKVDTRLKPPRPRGTCVTCMRSYWRGQNTKHRHKARADDGEKQCYRCHKFKPADLVHFVPDNRKPDGLGVYCRVCSRASSQDYADRMRAERARDIDPVGLQAIPADRPTIAMHRARIQGEEAVITKKGYSPTAIPYRLAQRLLRRG